MKKITFKKVNYGDYEVYLDDVKTNYKIDWKKDLKCYMAFNGDGEIVFFEHLSQAKEKIEHFIKEDEKRNTVYETKYIVIALDNKEMLCYTSDYEEAKQVADRSGGYMITTEFNGFNVPMSLSGCLY